jgi:hypothetical protein
MNDESILVLRPSTFYVSRIVGYRKGAGYSCYVHLKYGERFLYWLKGDAQTVKEKFENKQKV